MRRTLCWDDFIPGEKSCQFHVSWSDLVQSISEWKDAIVSGSATATHRAELPYESDGATERWMRGTVNTRVIQLKWHEGGLMSINVNHVWLCLRQLDQSHREKLKTSEFHVSETHSCVFIIYSVLMCDTVNVLTLPCCSLDVLLMWELPRHQNVFIVGMKWIGFNIYDEVYIFYIYFFVVEKINLPRSIFKLYISGNKW